MTPDMIDISIDFREATQQEKRQLMMDCLHKLKERGEQVDYTYSNQCNYICKIAGVYMPYIKPKDEVIVNFEDFFKQ